MSKEINMKQMSLLEDSPVNRSVSQEKEKESMTIDTSGMKLLESLENVNPNGSLAKMLKALLTSTTAWYSDRCKLTWKKKVSKSNVLLFQLQASVLGTKGKESGLWLTPTAMDIGTRSKESMERRKKYRTSIGRTTVPPGNLAEQVQYGMPTVNMYPTPSAQEAGEGEFLETLTSKDGTPLKPNERAYNPKTNKHVQMTLNRMVKMFPTPTTQEIEHPNMILTEEGRRLTKDGKNSHSLNLADTVKMYPTPRASAAMTEDMETIAKRNKYNSKLEEKVALQMYPTPTATERSGINPKTGKGGGLNHLITVKLYPTPTTRDYKDSTVSPSYKNRNSDSLPIKMMKEGKPGGKLNPEFVEFLMGYPLNWTKLDPTE